MSPTSSTCRSRTRDVDEHAGPVARRVDAALDERGAGGLAHVLVAHRRRHEEAVQRRHGLDEQRADDARDDRQHEDLPQRELRAAPYSVNASIATAATTPTSACWTSECRARGRTAITTSADDTALDRGDRRLQRLLARRR